MKKYAVVRESMFGKEWWGSLDYGYGDRRWSVKEDRILFDSFEEAWKVASEWNMMPSLTTVEHIVS